MNNHNLKKRRPHGHGEPFSISHSSSSVVPLSLTTSTSSSSSSQHSVPSQNFFGSGQYTPQELEILHQAASLLHCHIDQLLALDRRPHHLNYQDHTPYAPTAFKRQRCDTDNIKSSPSEDKPPPLSHYNEMPGGFFRTPGLHSSMSEETQGFARCLTSITSCSPCSTAAYDAPSYVPAPVMHDYSYMSEKLAYRDDEPSSSHFQASGVHMDPYRTAELEPPMLPSYPALQPSRAMITQPSTRNESMVYHSLGTNNEHAEHQHTDVSTAANHICLTQSANESESRGMEMGQYEAMRPTQPQGSPVFGIAETSRDLDIVLSSQRPPAAKRGPFRSNDERERTAETRKIGSCIRCRMQRIRCEIDPDDKHGTCLTCQRVSSVKIWRLPCLRYKITDVRLFKPGPVKGYEWTRRWTEGVPGDISLWESPDTKWVRVTEGYTNHSIMLRVRKFVPQDGDSLSRTWVANGQKREVQIPAYAIVNLDEAKSAYNEYIKSGYFDCCKSILKSKAKLLHATYMMAMKAAQDRQTPEKERELLTKALRLWMAIRLTTKSTVIVGNETLGMTRDIMDQTSPLHGQIPLPPVMGAQIELVLIHQIQSALRRELLENLQAMTQANKHKTWFTTYLVTFILLHNVALLCQHDAGYARKHGIKTRFARQDMVQEYQLGANILLAYYHYCTKGVYPFSPDCKDQDLSTLAELDESKTKVVLATRKVVKEHRNQWAKIRQSADYENDMFYISQLYEEQWSPLPTI